MKRTHKPFQEYFLVATGNQAMRKTGDLLASGSALNLSAGQLGMVNNRTGAYVPASQTVATVPHVYLVQGTPKSTNFSSLTGWHLQEQAYIKTPVITPDTIMSVSTQLPVVGTHSAVMLSSTSTPVAGNRYTVNMKFRSVRKDRTFGGNLDQFSVDYIAPTGATTSGVLGNLVYNVNRYSKMNTTLPMYSSLAANKHVLALGLDLDGAGSGTAIGALTVGATVNVSTDGTNTIVLTITKDILQTLYRAITDVTAITASTKIVNVNPSTAGAGAIDALVLLGLDHEEAAAYDDINQKKVTVEATYGGFATYTETTVCNAREWQGTGRELKIWYDERAFGQTGTQQLTGFADELLLPPNYIVETNLYTTTAIDIQNVDQADNGDGIVQQTRIWILLPATDTSGAATAADGIVTSTNAADTLTDLEAIVGSWVASNRGVVYRGAATAADMFI